LGIVLVSCSGLLPQLTSNPLRVSFWALGHSEDQKHTIASQALEANKRIVLLVTMICSILAAAVICLRKGQTGVFIGFLTAMAIFTILGLF
jgi:hypothetical protein